MDITANATKVGPTPEKPRRHKIEIPLAEREAYTPQEFAALFGRGQTWGYRMLYRGRVKAIKNLGRLLIPRSELERLSQELTVHGEGTRK